jgi:hypothetical protein
MKILILALVIPYTVAQFEQFGGQKQCPEFRCRKDETPVPIFPMKLTSAGCSAIGGGGFSMNGGAIDGEKAISSCCDLYHSCTQICGSTKSFCDSSFEKCMDKKCASINNAEEKKQCETATSTKKIMMQMTQCSDFSDGQRKNCECVKNDDVSEKRSEVVRAFYNKFNPSAADKADALAAKANDSKKFAGLLYKLVEKYPKAIRKVTDPRQKTLEDMMSDGKFKSRFDTSDEKIDIDDSDEKIEL